MNIPDKAIEAAREVYAQTAWQKSTDEVPLTWRVQAFDYAVKMLEAAAPLIAEQALRDYGDSLDRWIHIEGPLTANDVLGDIRNTYGDPQ